MAGKRWGMGLLVAVGLAMVMGPARADLDVGTPPGMPTEWDRGLFRPVPTDGARVPKPVVTPDRANPNDHSVVAEPPRQIAAPAQGLYGYFNIFTPDIPQHVIREFPEFTTRPGDNEPVFTDPNPLFEFQYPPAFPTELVWDGLCTALRLQLHPEIISEGGTYAHLIAVGEPADVGVGLTGTDELKNYMRQWVGDFNHTRPIPPSRNLRTQFDRMIASFATVELCSGYPYMFDPNYCRRLMSLEVDAVPAIVACTESGHKLLRRNATAILGNFPPQQSAERLRELATDRDSVVAVRALKALVTHRSPANAPIFWRLINENQPAQRSLAFDGIGRIGDPENLRRLGPILDRALTSNDQEILWDVLPAIARTGGEDARLVRMLASAKTKFERAFPKDNDPASVRNPVFAQPMFPEPVGYKNRLLWQMTLLALVSLGHESSQKELFELDPAKDIHRVLCFLYCDVLERIRTDAAQGALKKIIADLPYELIATYAMQRLINMGVSQDFLHEHATTGSNYVLRTEALVGIVRRNPMFAKQICVELFDALRMPSNQDLRRAHDRRIQELQRIVRNLSRDRNFARDPEKLRQYQEAMAQLAQLQQGNGAAGPDSREALAFFLTTVLNLGGSMGAFPFEKLYHFARRVTLDYLHAKRIGSNNLQQIPNVNVFPPLMETAIFELGRTADIRALPLLIEILNARLPFGSPEAAIVLGNYAYRAPVAALIDTLGADNGWLRFCAYRALRKISGEDSNTDWFFGNPAERNAGIRSFRVWFKKTFE